MTKVSLFSLLAIALVTGGTHQAQAQTLRIGTVDMKRVFDNYDKAREAEQRLNDTRTEATKQLDERVEAYKKGIGEVQGLYEELKRPELGKPARETLAKSRDSKVASLRKQEREVQEFQATHEQQLQEQTARVREGLLQEIMKVIDDRQKAEGFDLILDSTGKSLNGTAFILSARSSYDFTADVIAALNKAKAPAPAPAPAASPNPAAAPARRK